MEGGSFDLMFGVGVSVLLYIESDIYINSWFFLLLFDALALGVSI